MQKNTNNELKYWLGFSLIDNLGPVSFKKIIGHFKSVKEAWQSNNKSEFFKSGLSEKLVAKIFEQRPRLNLDTELEKTVKHNLSIINLNDPDYSCLLKEIYDPPPLLYYRGDIKILNQLPSLAVVGTRKISSYGQSVVQQLVKDLVRNNFIIVSGLAFGIDSLAHQTALENNGLTIAVLGSSLENIYPRSSYPLAGEIIKKNGLVISEFPVGTEPVKQNFPRRNRIISGLALGTLVIEAGEKSGALITAYNSLEQNREVFAVPGNIFNQNSLGTNSLIKKGAKLVDCIDDILSALEINQVKHYIKKNDFTDLTPEEKKLFDFLTNEPVHINKLIQVSQMNSAQVISLITKMELEGRVKNLGGANYVVL